MPKKLKNFKEKSGDFSNKIANGFKARSADAKKTTIKLAMLFLISALFGLIISFLYVPAKEIYYSESQFVKETKLIYSYAEETDERASQVEKANEASQIYGAVMDKYMNSDNYFVKNYSTIDSDLMKVIIAILLVTPFVAILGMFIKKPVNFVFAIINMVFVYPGQKIASFIKSFKKEKTSEIIPSDPVL